MRRKHGFGLFLAVALTALSVGCEGDDGLPGPAGPVGPVGPEGPAGPPGPAPTESEFAFLGDFGSQCIHCHATLVGDYVTTNHRFAFDDLGDSQDDLFCLQCHTTGFNCKIAPGQTDIDPALCEGPDDGFSGFVGDTTALGAERRAALEGVQCESCHGAMGPDFNAHAPILTFATQDDPVTGEPQSMCYKCHNFQVEEWKTSGHAMAAGGDLEALNDEFGRTSCDFCHSTEGFIRVNDPVFADFDFGGEINFIGCQACHDPHVGEAGGGNVAQLRNTSAVEVAYTFPSEPGRPENARMEGYGPGQTCAQCHRARRNNANVQNQIFGTGSAHPGPHDSPQMDMFIGAGSYEIPGFVYEGDHPHETLINDGCVTCHMAFSESFGGHIVHNFNPSLDVCTSACHPGATSFDIGGTQTEIASKLDSAAVLLGYADLADFRANWGADNIAASTWQREVGYSILFVNNSGDLGVHNPTYARSVIDNAIAHANDNLVP